MTSLPEDDPRQPWRPAQTWKPAAETSHDAAEVSDDPEPAAQRPDSFAPAEPAFADIAEADPAALPTFALYPPLPRDLQFEPPNGAAPGADLHAPHRIPNLGHFVLLLVLVGFGALFAGILSQLALRHHLFGASNVQQAMTNVRYALGSEAILYLAALVACLIVFPLVWQKGFFAGIQWNFRTAWRLRWGLVGAAFACFLLALLNTVLVPGPAKTPIEKIFHSPGAAWLLFGFGVTFAPFFEETFFRGFLLPAFCTCYDWIAELVARRSPHSTGLETDLGGRVRWPLFAQITAGVITAIPFAGLCAFPRSHDMAHIAVRILIPLAWLAAIGLAWLLLESRKSEPRKWEPRQLTQSSTPHSAYTALVDANQHPVWSMSAMILVSFYTSVAFALMHGQQTAYALGPFFLLIGVSLVLSAVRLSTRSLAASTLVHASYNFMLFFIMAVGTHGFRHLDKL